MIEFDLERESRPPGGMAGDRLIAGVWLALVVVVLRVTLQVVVDYQAEMLRGELLWEHAIEHLTLAAGKAWMLVALLACLPRGGAVAGSIRFLGCLLLGVMLLTGLPGGEPQYLPAMKSLRGGIGWSAVAVSAVAAALLDRWLTAPQRRYFRSSPAARFLVTAIVLLIGGGAVAASLQVIQMRRYTIEIKKVVADLLDNVDQDRAVVLRETGEGVRTGSILPSPNLRQRGGNRPALLMPAGSAIEFDIAPQGSCAFEFSYALDQTACRGRDENDAEITFRVQVDGVDALNHSLSVGTGNLLWFEEQVDLTEYSGKRVRITLSTEGRGEEVESLRVGFGRPLLKRFQRIARQPAEPDNYNVVLAVIESARPDHMSCYGYDRDTTPTLVELAEEGIVYENAFAPSNWTWPSTASLLTGLYPPAHGVVDPERCFMRDSLRSLPELLQERGVTTGGWSANPLVSRTRNFDQGFEVWREFPFRPGWLVTHEFRDWVSRYKDYQFFAYLHYTDPHHPYQAPMDAYRYRFAAPDVDLKLNRELPKRAILAALGEDVELPNAEQAQQLVDLYDGEVAFVDRELSRIRAELQRTGLWDRTILIVTADHGEEFLEHGNFGHGKTLYDEVLRVPLLVRLPPALGNQGLRVKELVDLTQIPALVMELLGAAQQGLPGSLGLPPTPWSTASLPVTFAHTTQATVDHQRSELFAVRNRDFKLITNREGSWQRLFDLRVDSDETSDVSAQYEDVQRGLRRQLEAWLKSCSKGAIDRPMDVDPATRARLEPLGYVLASDRK